MSHVPVLPVVVPMLTAIVLLLVARAVPDHESGLRAQRWVAGLSLVLQAGIAVSLLLTTDAGPATVYRLGNWPAPYAIVVVVDRLSALMIATTIALAIGVHLDASRADDRDGPFFHPLLQFQLMGLAGAFLTGDLFNLFVFFEILLIGSYGLLLFGDGAVRLKAGLAYIVVNLVGSALFLIGVGLIYGVLGTLNMADLAQKAALVTAADAPVVRTGALLLFVVFALKGAAAPLHLWLPSTYQAASAPASAMFSIMTKVGVYAIVRVHIGIFGPGQGLAGDVIAPWLTPAGAITLVLGTLGLTAARELKEVVSFLVLFSIGTLMIAVGFQTPEALGAALYYLPHSTLVMGGLFLLAEAVQRRRGEIGDRLSSGPLMKDSGSLSLLFLLGASAAVGLPPLSGFLGKALLLTATPAPARPWVWTVMLATSFIVLVVMARAGSVLFWNVASERKGPLPASAMRRDLTPAALLLASSIALSVFGEHVDRFGRAAAAQVFDRHTTIERVLHDDEPVPKTRDGHPPGAQGAVRVHGGPQPTFEPVKEGHDEHH